MKDKKLKLLAFAHHPIQYQSPIFRLLAEKWGEAFHVHFKDGKLGQGAVDPGFGVKVTWDSDVLSGYSFTFRDSASGVLEIFEILRRHRPEAVLLFLGYTDPWTLAVIAACTALRIPFMWRFEGSDGGTRSPLKRHSRDMILRTLYKAVPAFLSVGKSSFQHLVRLGVPESRIYSSPYNIDDVLFDAMAQESKLKRSVNRQELGIGEDDFVFIFSGKLIPRKDPLLVLKALEASSLKDKASLIILGTGELMGEVELRAKAVLGKRVKMAGFTNQSQMGKYYSVADAAILPSRRETWGLVVNEAMMFELPVIVSDKVESHLDLVTPSETGFVFPVGESEALREHMEFLMTHRDVSRKMGLAARYRIAQYTTEAAAHGIFDAFEALIGLRRAA